MSAHTPGPWRVAPPSVGRFKVCTVSGGRIVGESSNYCVDAEANARLIAAAPELLKALQDLIEAADSMLATCGCIRGDTPEDSDTHTHDDWAEKFLAERVREAAAAYAKAAGEQA